MAYDFLKKLFGTPKEGEEPKAMTYEELEAAIDADGNIKIADLSGGGYVSKEKYNAKVTELTGVKQQLTDANTEIQSYKDMDIEGIQKSAKEWEDNYSVCDGVLITDIKTVQIDGTDYAAVYVDNGGKTFDTTANSTYFSTSPYYSGWNDNVLGRDGSRYNSTSGKEPAMIQGIEFMNGAYMIIADELCQWGKDEEGNYTFDLYKCYDQTKCGNAIDANYIKLDVPTIVLPPDTPNWSWKYIPDNAICKDALWPYGVDASGSGVGVGAGFFCYPAASGVRASWVFGNLDGGGSDGVACRLSNIWVSYGYTFWEQLAANGYDPSKIKKPCETDCSQSTASIVKAVGYRLNKPKLKAVSIYLTTYNMRSAFKTAGAKVLTDQKYLTSGTCLKPGDILLNDNHHVAIAVSGDASSNATPAKKNYLEKGDTGSEVTTMQKRLIKVGYSCGAAGADGDFGSDTDSALRKFQKDNGLTVDGQYGTNSKAKLTALYNKKVGTTTSNKKDVTTVAKEVIAGKWGSGDERKKKLTAAGYNYDTVQKKVNELLKTSTKKSVAEVAKEVVSGKWGNGTDRKKKLEVAGYDHTAVQKEVNRLLKK